MAVDRRLTFRWDDEGLIGRIPAAVRGGLLFLLLIALVVGNYVMARRWYRASIYFLFKDDAALEVRHVKLFWGFFIRLARVVNVGEDAVRAWVRWLIHRALWLFGLEDRYVRGLGSAWVAFEGFSTNTRCANGAGGGVDFINLTNGFTLSAARVAFGCLGPTASEWVIVVRASTVQVWVRSGCRILRLFVEGCRRDPNGRIFRVGGLSVMFVEGVADVLLNDLSRSGVLGGESFRPFSAVFRLPSSGLDKGVMVRVGFDLRFFGEIAGDGLLFVSNANNGPVLLLFERLQFVLKRVFLYFKYTSQFRQSVFSLSGHRVLQGVFED